MRTLVATVAYPEPEGSRTMYFVHSRSLYYVRNGIDVTILNFSAKKNYVIDNINVITLDEYVNHPEKYDV